MGHDLRRNVTSNQPPTATELASCTLSTRPIGDRHHEDHRHPVNNQKSRARRRFSLIPSLSLVLLVCLLVVLTVPNLGSTVKLVARVLTPGFSTDHGTDDTNTTNPERSSSKLTIRRASVIIDSLYPFSSSSSSSSSPLSQFNSSNPDDSPAFTHPDASSLQALPLNLSRYVSWHAAMRRCLLLTTDDALGCPSLVKVLVWRCPVGKCAGIGDRIRGLQFALVLAVVTRRVLFVDWPSNPFPFTHGVRPGLIDWRLPSPSPSSLSSSTLNFSLLTSWPTLNWYSCFRRVDTQCTERRFMPHDSFLAPPSIGPRTGERLDDGNDDYLDLRANATGVVHLLSSDNLPSLVISTRQRVQSLLSLLPFAHFDDMFTTMDTRRPLAGEDVLIYNSTTRSASDEDDRVVRLQRSLLTVLLRPSHTVETVLSRLLSRAPQQRPDVAVHVRTGLDLSEAGDSRFRGVHGLGLPGVVERVMTVALNLSRESGVQNDSALSLRPPTVFIATDSQLLKREALRWWRTADNRLNAHLALSDVPPFTSASTAFPTGHNSQQTGKNGSRSSTSTLNCSRSRAPDSPSCPTGQVLLAWRSFAATRRLGKKKVFDPHD